MSELVHHARPSLSALAAEIRREVEQAEADYRSAVQHAVRAGELLIEAKAQVQHGQWLPWLEANFPGSARSPQGYMRLAENAEDAQRVAHLGIYIRAEVAPRLGTARPFPLEVRNFVIAEMISAGEPTREATA
jgi:hypothetical protein